jgi:LCP family protein required for cell wall assembly
MRETSHSGAQAPIEDNDQNEFNPTDSMQKSAIVDVVPTYSNTIKEEENHLEQVKSEVPQKKRSRVTFGKLISVFVFFIAVILIGVFIFGYTMISNKNSMFGSSDEGGDLFSQIGQIGSILNITKRNPIKGEKEGRTNFLLLGRDESGSDLTDTIMIVSYYHREKKIVTLNIPRDFWVYNETKINALYTFGEQENVGGGAQKLTTFISDEYGLPVHYYAIVNFNGVKEIVDTIGGVDINVVNDFTDCQYPNDGYQWINGSSYMKPCPTFKTGKETMDGKRALIYARSRYSAGLEGGDFSRSKRQSIVVQSILQKIKNQNILDNASKIGAYLGIIEKNFKTNMRLDEMTSFAQILRDVDLDSGFLRASWDNANGFLCSGWSSNGQSIVQYCDGSVAGYKSGGGESKTQARDFVQNLLQKVENSSMFESSVALYGNGSFDTDTMYQTFLNWGFTDVKNNNAYTVIAPATASSKEKVEVYIKDAKLREQFEQLQNNSKLTYTVGESLPSSYKIPSNQSQSDIVVWVSSQK